MTECSFAVLGKDKKVTHCSTTEMTTNNIQFCPYSTNCAPTSGFDNNFMCNTSRGSSPGLNFGICGEINGSLDHDYIYCNEGEFYGCRKYSIPK